jgi:protein involved in polysaccharide export with SLBB domain
MIKFKFLTFFFLVVFLTNIYAQELDPKYLETLPEDIKLDLEKRADTKNKDAEQLYRSSLYSSKLEKDEELEDLKTRIQVDLAELERRLKQNDGLEVKKELKIFGLEFFNTFQTSFMPINEPNPDSAYVLDVGDMLNIQLIGQEDFVEKFPVNRDGSINIPKIGKIIVAGLSISDASSLIKARVSSSFIGTDAFINLDQIRDVNILVSGNAKKPGIYTLSGNSNILHAITVAGGVDEYGSLREINLVRENEVIETLDVYKLLIDGNYNLKKRLRSGDVIFVKPRNNLIAVDGAVMRPAKYELKINEKLDSIIKFSNGLKQTADLQNIFLERMLDGTLKSIPITNISQFQQIDPIDGDLIYVREFAYREATISGAVYKPGSYTMAAGETIEDLIEKAGGFTDSAYPFGAVYENNDAKLVNKKAKELLYEEFLDNIIAMSQQNISEKFDLTPILSLTREIKNSEPSGRIVVDLTASTKNISLNIRAGDKVIIPEKTNNIYVYGEVSSEGAVMFSQNKTVDYFVEKSGGYKKFADNDSIYILHPNGETQRYSKKRNLFANSPHEEVYLYPGSVIFVPRKLDNSATRRLATQAYVSILGNLGVALASLSAIDNN